MCMSFQRCSLWLRASMGLAFPLALAALTTFAAVSPVSGQQSAADLERMKKEVIIGKRPLGDAERKALGGRGWYFERLKTMALKKEEAAGIRLEILKDLKTARERDAEPARQFVRDEMLRILPSLIRSPKVTEPAAKVNAILLLGELNQSETPRDQTLPVPSPQARKLLLSIVEDPNYGPALKVAALVGLRRHAQLEMVQGNGQRLREDAPKMISLMTQILEAAPPSASQADGHHWMQRTAAEILGILGSAGPNGSVVVALDKIVRDDQSPIWLRCAAVHALGRINVPGTIQEVKPAETIAAAGMLAVNSCKAEAARLEAWETEHAKANADRFGGGRMDEPPRVAPPPPERRGGRGNVDRRRNGRRGRNRDEVDRDEPPIGGIVDEYMEYGEDPGKVVVLAARRRLIHQLGSVRAGLSNGQPGKGLQALASGSPAEKLAGQIGGALDGLLKSLDQSDIQPGDLRQTVESGAKSLAGLLAGGPAAAATPATPDPSAKSKPDDNPFSF